MKLIFCINFLSATAIILYVVQADYQQSIEHELRNNECRGKSERCQKQMTTKFTDEEVIALCDAKPLTTTSSKCLIDCQMRQYKWLNYNKFQQKFYLRKTTMRYNQTHMEVAKKSAHLCKDKKALNGDSCETAFLIMQCLQQEGHKYGISNLGYGLFFVDSNKYSDILTKIME